MIIPHQTIKMDINLINPPFIKLIEHVNDCNVRYVDLEIYSDSVKMNIPETATALATFVTDGVLISEDVECSINSSGNIEIPVDNSKIQSKSGLMLVEVRIVETGDTSTTVLNTPFAFKVRVNPSIKDNAHISEKSYGTTAELLKEIAEARGSYDTILEHINSKSDKDKTEFLSNKVSDRTHITDTGENYPSIEYLDSYYYNYTEIDDLLGEKLDSSNIVSGTCELTPDTTTTAKSGICTYTKIGNMVFINAKLTFNSPETAGVTNKYARFGNLPFATSSEYNSGNISFLTSLSNSGSFYFRWNKIVASLSDSKKPADDETTNISLFYIINS
jgi:hypothetical protein